MHVKHWCIYKYPITRIIFSLILSDSSYSSNFNLLYFVRHITYTVQLTRWDSLYAAALLTPCLVQHGSARSYSTPIQCDKIGKQCYVFAFVGTKQDTSCSITPLCRGIVPASWLYTAITSTKVNAQHDLRQNDEECALQTSSSSSSPWSW